MASRHRGLCREATGLPRPAKLALWVLHDCYHRTMVKTLKWTYQGKPLEA